MSALASRLSRFVSELKRRHVFRIAIAYGVVAFIIVQAADIAAEPLRLPAWFMPFVIVCVVLGFPLALVLAWAFDITPTGVRRTDAAPAPPRVEETGSKPVEVSGAARMPARPAVPGAEDSIRRGTARPGAVVAEEDSPPDPERVERVALAQLRDELRTPAKAIVDFSRTLLEEVITSEHAAIRADLAKVRAAGELFLTRLEEVLDPDSETWDRNSPNREELLSRMRHDLRTPLNAIIGYSELILEDQLDPVRDEAIAAELRRIVVAGRQVLATIEEIVRFATTGRAEGGGLIRSSALAQEVLAKIHSLKAGGTGLPLRQGRLLVADDVEANRELISHQLARQGYTVSAAENGREALEMLASQDFDLLLLDILMPELDGVEVLRRVRSDPALRELPVIVISALDDVDSVVRCIEMGADDYVSKPFDPVLLGARIGTILEVRRLRERERAWADALRREQQWVDDLLGRTFPAGIAEKLKAGETGIVESGTETTVLVAGLQGSLTRASATALADRLGELYARFDGLVRAHGLEIARASGQGYLVAAGIPTPRADHARVIASLALALQEETQRYAEESGELIRLRIGIHTGALAVGIIASERLSFDVWGDAAETAQQLQLHAAGGSIQVSPATWAKLHEEYAFISRGVVDIPGKGQMRAYLLQGRLAAEPTAY